MTIPFVPAADCVKAELLWVLDNQKLATVLNFQGPHPILTTDMTALATALKALWVANLQSFQSNQIALERIKVTDLTTISSPSINQVYTPPTPGGSSDPSLALNVATVVTHRTGLRGRNYRGRTYVPGIRSAAQVGPGEISTGAIASILPFFTALLTPANIATFVWIVLSKFIAKTPRSVALPTQVTAVSMDTLLDSQRRRLVGRGS